MNPSKFTRQRIWTLIVCIVAMCSSFASADSLHLRDGRHLQGKYVGGSTNMIGFMTSGSIEYFQTSDVLALIFDSSAEPPVNGLQPNHMNGDSPEMIFPGAARKISAHPRRHTRRRSRPEPKKENTELRYVAD
jgi:hypothetical protein